MALTPNKWNVIVVGHWNPAILTPIGIARYVFRVAENTPIEVLVRLDEIGPILVRHDGLIVTVDASNLIIESEVPTFEGLAHAMRVAVNAIESLPVTPFSAAGFNVRYLFETTDEAIIGTAKCAIDDRLSDASYRISARKMSRSLVFQSGNINLIMEHQSGGACTLVCNFNLDSKVKDELVQWLRIPAEEIRVQVESLLTKALGLDLEEIHNEQDSATTA